jgi:hypothetical protein
MNFLSAPQPIAELSIEQLTADAATETRSTQPWVVRSLVRSWPMVDAAIDSDEMFLQYLLGFYRGHQVSAFLGEPEIDGRFFYNENQSGFNFIQVRSSLSHISQQLLELAGHGEPASLYVGSTNIDHWLPGLGSVNELPLSLPSPLTSLWLGNRSIIAPHFDYPANIACCVAGRRRFLLFPPDQVNNLYVGPWDLTPAGQPISLVDTRHPDIERFPLYQEAMKHAQVAELEPGDAIYVPSLWWHQVESLASINALVNYWWTSQPAVYGAPMDALTHAMMALKSLPIEQRSAWKALFDYYVFSESAGNASHWQGVSADRAGPLNENLARQLRAELMNHLKR